MPLFLPPPIQPPYCPGVLMRSYSNHNSCAHSHTHTRGAAANLASLTLSQPSSLLAFRLGCHLLRQATKTEGLSPRKFSLRARSDDDSLCPGSGGGCLFSAAGRKEESALHASGSELGSRPRGRPRRGARVPLPHSPTPTHSSPLAPNFAFRGSGCLSPHPPLPALRGVGLVRCLKDHSGRTKRSLHLFIYSVPLRRPPLPTNPPRFLSYRCG